VKHAKEQWKLHARKMNGMGFNSWPDRMFLIPGGRPLFIEFKRLGHKATEAQSMLHDQLQRLGYAVAVCDNAEEAIALLSDAVSVALNAPTPTRKLK
jgi:hypothetical protein